MPASPDKPKQHWWQFSLRKFFVIITLFGMVSVCVITPFVKIPPSSVQARRNLESVWILAGSRCTSTGQLVVKKGPIVLKGEVVTCPACNRPFVFHPKDETGNAIALQGFNKNTPVAFIACCEKAHRDGKRWFLFNNGYKKLLPDSDIDWKTHELKDIHKLID